MPQDMRDWVERELVDSDGYYAPSGFPESRTLYTTALHGSFVLSVIDGSSTPAQFVATPPRSPYATLIRAVRRVTSDQPAVWFYGGDPDNSLSLLNWVRQCDYQHSVIDPLEAFETEPAPQGGRSWLGLAAEDRSWLVSHEHFPHSEFHISIHGPREFCAEVAAEVGL